MKVFEVLLHEFLREFQKEVKFPKLNLCEKTLLT